MNMNIVPVEQSMQPFLLQHLTVNMSDVIDMHELLEVLKDQASLDLLGEVRRLRNENARLQGVQNEKDKLVHERHELRNGLVVLNDQYIALRQRYDLRISQLDQRDENHERRMTLLEQRLSHISQDIDRANRKFRRKELEVSRETARADNAQKAVFDATKKLIRQQNENRRLRKLLRELKAKLQP